MPTWPHFLLFTSTNLAALAVALTTARLTGFTALGDRVLCVLIGFPVIAELSMLLAGALGLLSAPVVLLILLIALAVTTALAYRHSARPSVPPTLAGDSLVPSEGLLDRASLAAGLFLALSVGLILVLRFLQQGTGFFSDDYAYHAAVVGKWIQSGSLVFGCDTGNAYFPMQAELLSAWWMLPLRSDGMASLSGLYWCLCLGATAAACSTAWRLPVSAAATTVALLLASPVLQWQALRFSANELAGAAPLVMAIYFTARARASETGRERRYAIGFAAAAAGLAAGSKVTFIPLAGLLALATVFRRSSTRVDVHKFVEVLLFTCVAAVVGGYWYVRDWLVTGNPVFPAEFGPFAGPFDRESLKSIKLSHYVATHPLDAGLFKQLLTGLGSWPYSLWAISILGYLGIVVYWSRGRAASPQSGHGRDLFFLLALCGLASLALFPWTPWSANSTEHGMPLIYIRYVMFPYVIGLMLFPAIFISSRSRAVLYPIVVALLVANALNWTSRSGLVALALSAVLSAGAVWMRSLFLARVSSLRRVPPSAPLVLGGVAILLLGIVSARQSRMTDRYVFLESQGGVAIGKGWKYLESLPAGSRIARFCNSYWGELYPLMGRKLQHSVVFVNEDGTQKPLLHTLFRRRPDFTMSNIIYTVPDSRIDGLSAERLIDNLERQGVEYVFVSRFGGPEEWPPQYEVVKKSPKATCVYDDGANAVFRLPTSQHVRVEQPKESAAGTGRAIVRQVSSPRA